MVLSARRRTAVKRGAFAVAIAIVFAALIAAPQVFHTSTPPRAPASQIADVTETSPDAGADVAKTVPRPSGLSTAVVARAGQSFDALAIVLGLDVDLSEMPDLDLGLAQIPGTSDQDLFSGVDGLFAGCDSNSCVDQPIDVPEMQLARYYPLGPSTGGFAGGSRRGSAASGDAGGGGGPGVNANGNSSQLNSSSPGGNTGDGGNGNNNGGNGNNNGGNGNNNIDQPNGTNPHGDEHSQGEIHSSSGNNPSGGPGGGPIAPSSIGSSEEPISVPEPSTLLLSGFGLSGLMAFRRLTHRAR